MFIFKKRYLLKFLILAALFFCLFRNIPVATASGFYSHNPFISYTEIGEGKPLILIHAFPTDHHLWQLQQDLLKKHFRVITVDLWGFGESSDVDGDAVSMTDYADEIKQLLEHLNLDKAIIGGESMGGYVALAFLEKYPQQLEGLVLANTQSIADSPETKVQREKTAAEVLQYGTANLINGFMTKALTVDASEDTKLYLHHILTQQKPTAIASALRGMALRHDTSDLLSKTTLPILIINSDQDFVIPPQQSVEMSRLAKNSRLVTLTHAGHLSNLEQPDRWSQAVVDMF